MSSEMLLINPRRRRRASGSVKRRKSSTSRRRVKRNPIGNLGRFAGLGRRRARRRNPIGRIGRRIMRRRRNPISLGGLNTNVLMRMFKDAAVGGAGAIAMDLVMGQVNGFLPASFQTVAGTVSVGDAVKAGITALLGQTLNKATKGLSSRMAAGALTVQAYEILSGFMPATMPVGYMSPARIINGSPRVGPTRAGMQMQAYQRSGGRTPLLNAYQAPGGRSPMLSLASRQSTIAAREGVSTYR